jgi:hypothetical protein
MTFVFLTLRGLFALLVQLLGIEAVGSAIAWWLPLARSDCKMDKRRLLSTIMYAKTLHAETICVAVGAGKKRKQQS